MDPRTLQQIDPLHRQPDEGLVGDGLSPMDPPEAYAPPALPQVPVQEMHPFLQQLCAEHAQLLEALQGFEATILAIQETGFTKERDAALRQFFQQFDRAFVPQCRREEMTLFPLLRARLLADGEHSKTEAPTTAVELMQDEHIKAVQRAAVVLNFLGLAMRLPDEHSRLIVLDAALEQGKQLVELLRLHLFREDHILFAQAHRLIAGSEFDTLWNRT